MDILERIAKARDLTETMDATIERMVLSNTWDDSSIDHEGLDYDMTRLQDEVDFLLTTPNQTLPTLDRLYEKAVENGVVTVSYGL